MQLCLCMWVNPVTFCLIRALHKFAIIPLIIWTAKNDGQQKVVDAVVEVFTDFCVFSTVLAHRQGSLSRFSRSKPFCCVNDNIYIHYWILFREHQFRVVDCNFWFSHTFLMCCTCLGFQNTTTCRFPRWGVCMFRRVLELSSKYIFWYSNCNCKLS